MVGYSQEDLKISKRKPPVRHRVRAHTRNGKPVKEFHRGEGARTKRGHKKVGRSSRSDVEQWRHKTKEIQDRFVEEYGTYWGLCFEVSFLVSKAVKGRLVYGGFDGAEHHFWVEKNGYIIDATVRRFDETLPDIVITPISNKRWRKRESFSCDVSVRKVLEQTKHVEERDIPEIERATRQMEAEE